MLKALLTLAIGGLIGWIAQIISGQGSGAGIMKSIIAGFTGAWIGYILMGSFGPSAGDLAVIPALAGAVLFMGIVILVKKAAKPRNKVNS